MSCRVIFCKCMLFFYAWHSMSVCLRCTETSQAIIVIHHTYVQLPFQHRNKVIGRGCRGQRCVELQSPLKSIAQLTKCLCRLDFVTSSIRVGFHNFIDVLQHNNTIFLRCLRHWYLKIRSSVMVRWKSAKYAHTN